MLRKEETICLLYTSDVHGHWTRGDGQSEGSLASAANYAVNRRKSQEHVWLIDNGDLLQGTPLAHHVALNEGESGMRMMGNLLRASGVNMVVPGNHDFDYGLPYLKGVIAASSCIWLAANVRHCSGKNLTQSYYIATFGTVRVAFIGVTTRVPALKNQERLEGWEWLDEVDTVKSVVKQLKPIVDAIVVCYHGGLEQDGATDQENAALRMVREVEGIDVLLTGHQHNRWVRREGNTLMLQPGSHGAAIGEVMLRFSSHEEEKVQAEGRIVDITAQPESEEVLAEVLDIRNRARNQLGKALCCCDPLMQLHDWRDLTRIEHPLVEWLHRVQLKESRAQLSAVAYAGEKKLKFPSGKLTRGDVQRIFPYMDSLSIFQIEGAVLLSALEVSASWYEAQTLEPQEEWLKPHLQLYQFIMFEGIQYTIDVSRPIGKRLQACEYQGKAVRHTDMFTIVMTDYLAGQASRYPMFRRMKRLFELEEPFLQLLERDAGSHRVLELDYTPNWRIIGGNGLINTTRRMPKAVAFDMDGTLLRSEGTLSERTVAALQRYSDNGGIIIIATGRPPRLVLPLFPQLAIASYFIYNNGANVVNAEEDWRVERPITNVTARLVHQHVLKHHADGICIWEVEDRWHANRRLSEEEKACFLGPVSQLDPIILSEKSIRELQPSKMLLPRKYDVYNLAEVFQEELNIYRLSSAPCVELTLKTSSKATGVEGIALRLGLSRSEIGAFGDDFNDVAMFQYCDHTVAMHNAIAELASIAAEKTVSNDEDGVAVKLEQWLKDLEQ